MRDVKTSYNSSDFYLLREYGHVALLKLGKKFLANTIELAVENPLLDVLDHIAGAERIKVLVIMNCIEQIGSKQFIDFCRQVCSAEVDRRSIQRMCNAFDQLILKTIRLNKPVIHADCGEVIPLFLSLSLVCDYRIIADDTIFQKPYFELQALPKGGSAFLLCKMLGYSRAKHLLMSEKDISAIEALEIGVVDQVVPFEKLEETAILKAQEFGKRSIPSLVGVKRLMNYSMKDMQDYLEFESFELLRTIER